MQSRAARCLASSRPQPCRAILAPARVGCSRRVKVLAAAVDVEAAKKLIDKEGFKVLDVRTAREYDNSHITKPAMSSVNVPFVEGGTAFVDGVSAKFRNKAAGLLVVSALPPPHFLVRSRGVIPPAYVHAAP
jgi:hypothetical protein